MNYPLLTRRQMLGRMCAGFGLLGLAGMPGPRSVFASEAMRKPHFAPRAKRVIFLFLNGGPSHVDTFDPKPELLKREGEKPTGELYRGNKVGKFVPSPFRFGKCGQSGIDVSETLPNLARVIDDCCIIRSMKTDVPNHEPEFIRKMYGETTFARSCLLARRLAEDGVRFVTVYYTSDKDNQPWDTHANHNERHRKLCVDGDQAAAALIADLKARGMLDDTLVIWGGEFGRTPYAEIRDKDSTGRDHHHTAFTMLLAGGGVKGGFVYGSSDELGMRAVENPVHVHDLHATVLYLMGIDHERLTYRYAGRDFRLTDVHGRIVKEIIA